MIIDKILLSTLRAFFAPEMFRQGQTLYEDNAVTALDITLDCKNKHDHISSMVLADREEYNVKITLERTTKGSSIMADCDCFKTTAYCKHEIATLIAAVTRFEKETPAVPKNMQNNPEIDRWIHSFDNTFSTSTLSMHPQKTTEKTPAVYQFYYELSLKPSYSIESSTRISVSLHYSKQLKSGQWNEKKAFDPDKKAHHSYLNDEALDLLLQLKGIRSLYGQHMGYQDRYFVLSHHVGEKVLNQLIATKRCYWDKEDAEPLIFGPNKKAQWHWQKDNDGLQQLRCSSEPLLYFFVIEHLWYVNPNTHEIGLFETTMNANVVTFLLQLPKLPMIQAEKMFKTLMQHKKQVSIPLPAMSDDQPLKIVQPIPHLRLFLGSIKSPGNYDTQWKEIVVPQASAELLFDYDGIVISEKDTRHVLQQTDGKETIQIQRDTGFETECVEKLQSYGWTVLSNKSPLDRLNPKLASCFILDPFKASKECLLKFSARGVPRLKEAGWNIDIAADYPCQILMDEPEEWYSTIDDTSQYDWFGLELGITLQGQQINLLPIVQQLLQKLPNNASAAQAKEYFEKEKEVFAQLPDGRYLPLPLERIRHILTIFIELYDAKSLTDDNQLRLSKLHAMRLLELEKAMGAASLRWVGGDRLRKMAKKLEDFKGIKTVQASDTFQGTLRPYQIEGLSWLQFLREYEFSGILADDMGLGKTVQALAHLLVEKVNGRMSLPSLIVAPTSLMFNWQKEAARFAPELNVLLLHGINRKIHFDHLKQYDLILTTYPLIVRDKAILCEQPFYYLILDEAQCIKNHRTQFAQVALQIEAKHRLCMTGTPMENHLGELWSLFHFMMPGLLGEQKQFTRHFRTPIEKQGDNERRNHLNRRIAPFLLRRTKEKVVAELPPKIEIIRHVELEGAQRDLYEAVRVTMEDKVRKHIARLGLNRSHIIILEALLKLRQICCDPRLLKIPEAQKKRATSAKLTFLMEFIGELLQEGRRILLFSQFTEMLGLIEVALKAVNIPYVILTGKTTDRQTPVEQFQDGKVPLFLISLKAGGTGLNLTAADTVIHYDPWWNPAVESQATDRAHRIGQDKTVFVYKIVSKNTVEEKILEMQERKRALMDSLFSENQTSKLAMSEDDLKGLFEPLEQIG